MPYLYIIYNIYKEEESQPAGAYLWKTSSPIGTMLSDGG